MRQCLRGGALNFVGHGTPRAPPDEPKENGQTAVLQF